ncbi:UdgX family uracil-DNA binding protein [Mycolicibacter hiberniae]|uniref:Type-4 uracil-DNA glycosylase n=1 Tax=Mycolicibacter hiberniae TaxID=29314 RepID=A0A7I7X3A2_9MYCO|nr:UdgX family uracil-DNA binding protein [Mycolicibacter hiberniae]MCV7085975.1 UdgX family uracil-DNA binding protein [Mycolicibacter hiberniae]ORV72017.1 uracil-DNA glycosylase [Mycolicibacter hiberniae]BBZ24084.1 uracil-DNA glycosylase [Mycolicibacter hiberniae]
MAETKVPGAQRYLPERRTLAALREAAGQCRGCTLYRDATQTVFGEGRRGAPLMLVGEQPGDHEDLEGHPFVGPAGRLLDRAVREAGIDPELTYVTNAVKHFRFTSRTGTTRRIHQTPSRTEVVACRPWLIAEIDSVRPYVVVCLGATAAQSLLGPSFRISHGRGELRCLPGLAGSGGRPQVLATVHPSAVLRDRSEQRAEAYRAFVDDLRVARKAVSETGAPVAQPTV